MSEAEEQLRALFRAARQDGAAPPVREQARLTGELRALRRELPQPRPSPLYAELLLRTLGKEFGKEGSFAGGCEVVEKFLSDRGLLRSGYCCVDGSGLSYLNKTSTRMLADLLQYMHGTPQYSLYLEPLPQGGKRGSLQNRFQDNDETKALAERIFAKTGWIGGVTSLSGYIPGKPGVSFSVLLNDYECPDTAARNLVDAIALAIAKWNQPAQQLAGCS